MGTILVQVLRFVAVRDQIAPRREAPRARRPEEVLRADAEGGLGRGAPPGVRVLPGGRPSADPPGGHRPRRQGTGIHLPA